MLFVMSLHVAQFEFRALFHPLQTIWDFNCEIVSTWARSRFPWTEQWMTGGQRSLGQLALSSTERALHRLQENIHLVNLKYFDPTSINLLLNIYISIMYQTQTDGYYIPPSPPPAPYARACRFRDLCEVPEVHAVVWGYKFLIKLSTCVCG